MAILASCQKVNIILCSPEEAFYQDINASEKENEEIEHKGNCDHISNLSEYLDTRCAVDNNGNNIQQKGSDETCQQQ